MTTTNYDITIIGAGVLGVTLAYHLRDSGLRVCLVEKEGGVAMHASGRNAGMIRQLYKNPYLTDWAERSVAGFPKDIKEKCFKTTGSLIVGRTIPEHHRYLFEQKMLILKSGQFPAVYTKSDGLLDSGSYVEALRESTKDKLAFLKNTNVNKIVADGDQWIIKLESGEQLDSSIIVNATGAWFNSILPAEHPKFKIEAFRRHLMVSKNWGEASLFDPNKEIPKFGFYWDEAHEWYMRDWGEGEKLVSACEKIPSDPDSNPDLEGIEYELSEKLKKPYPGVYSEISIGKSWYCFRTYTKSELPIWGKDPYNSNLFHIGAFGGFGMSTSYAATMDLSKFILGVESFDYKMFDPQNFMN
jgi:glycine/D-amino acid oxidase-like deaminating enzyme